MYNFRMSEHFSCHGWKFTFEQAKLPDGRTTKDVRVHRPEASHIIALVDDDHVLLIKEFQPFYGHYMWTLPGGKLDKELDLIEGAQRQLREETGYRANSLKELWRVNVSDTLNYTHHIFLGKDLVKDPLPQDDDELIEVHTCTLEEALKNVESSEKIHMPSAYALRRFMT